eukprot:459311-Prymnesium_polylepis.1
MASALAMLTECMRALPTLVLPAAFALASHERLRAPTFDFTAPKILESLLVLRSPSDPPESRPPRVSTVVSLILHPSLPERLPLSSHELKSANCMPVGGTKQAQVLRRIEGRSYQLRANAHAKRNQRAV